MTEAGPAGTTLYPDEQIAKAGSIGRTGGPGVDLRVVRMDGLDAQPGETGEIWLKTDSMMLGYLDDAAATRAAFAPDGWYRTGDIARIDQDGYLFIVDRLKDMIVTGGENVYSKEVEDVLGAHPDIAEAAVVGVPHPDWGETVVAHVVLRAGQRARCGCITRVLRRAAGRLQDPARIHVRAGAAAHADGQAAEVPAAGAARRLST